MFLKGFKPEKGQSQWTRSCQNSGNDKKRRPDIIGSENMEKLVKSGYKLNEKTGYFERSVELTVKTGIPVLINVDDSETKHPLASVTV